MEDCNLLELLESDREAIIASIDRDRSPVAAQAALEKAMDRLMLRASEQYSDPSARDTAQLTLRSIRSAIPLTDSVNDVRRWEMTKPDAGSRRIGKLAMAELVCGAALILGGLFAHAIAGIVPAALGFVGVFHAGTQCGKPGKGTAALPPGDVREEFLVDPDRVFHHLRGMMMLADSAIETALTQHDAESEAVEASPIDPRELELFSELLEKAYAQDNDDAREAAESIRFYLHGSGIEVVDSPTGHERWFEYLPAQRAGTIRPALVAGDKLLKKGLASA